MERINELENLNFQDEESLFDGFLNGNVQDSLESIVAGNNQTQTTEFAAYGNNQTQTTESATYGNLVAPPLLFDDSHPLPWSPNSSDPLSKEALQDLPSSMVGLFSEGAAYQSQYEIPNMVQASGNQMLNETRMQNSVTALLQSDPVEARAGTGKGILNDQFITNQRSVVYPGTWNTNTSPAPYPSYGSHSQFGTMPYNSFASKSSVPIRPMNPMGTRIEQVAPMLPNTIAPQFGRATMTSPSSWVQPLENVEIGGNNIGQSSSHKANSRRIKNSLYEPTLGKSGYTFDPHIRAWERLTRENH
ncbi:PREDICTED: uncharacterized protein LOC109356125 isoform X2 [Lupinus angustifolius]|uniref:uncharacterized protein LOC109356125 isoform X2 n=1 Tax=Lupinus angustifolius TaxID=3871 RepID=UPI00092EAB45|nr:PREDICTED: uncharacterized protein LOC109356125 isoform X2 [Lupinus angustifolius]